MRYALRTLARTPGFATVVVLTLAVGIGVSAAIFSVVRAVVLRPLDYPDADQLVRITSELRGFGASDTGVAPAELIDYQSRADLFTNVAGILPVSANITGGGTPERVEMMLVSWNYFDVLRVRAALGRTFTRDDDAAGVANVAVVSDAFWRRRLDADPSAVGRTVVIDADPILIVGVMPSGFRHPGRVLQGDVDAWSPAGFRGPGSMPPSRSRRRLEGALARLQPGVTIEQAQSRLADYGVAVTREFPSDYPERDGWRPRIVPLQDDLVSGVATPMFVLLAGVGLLLLVACVNVAHLFLARVSTRRHEIAIRQALGASARRLASDLLAEGVLLTGAGTILAVLVASWTLRGLIALAPARVPRLYDARLDVQSLSSAALIALVVTVAFSLGPLLRARRADAVDAVGTLKSGGTRQSTGGRGSRARSGLVVAEVAMATILLAGAGLFVRTVIALLHVPVGFETAGLVTARLTLPRPNDASRAVYLDPGRRVEFFHEALRRVSAIPGVEHAALSTQIPLGGFNPPLFVELEAGSASVPAARPVVHSFQVSSGYFETMGIPLLRGRAFTDLDRFGAEPVAIVSDSAARKLWSGADPIGKRLRFSADAPWLTVIGVAGDVLNRRLTEAPQPIAYRPLDQASDLSLALLVRTRADLQGLGASIGREVAAVDPQIPLYALRTMDDLIEGAVAQRQFLMRLLIAFGVVATALALLGIYGVMAYAVSQRTREIGVRMAIGAQPRQVSWMVLRGGLLLTTGGAVAGILAALALSRVAESQLFGVRPWDPMTMSCVLAAMIGVAAAAAYLPARRAARVDPVTALRAQ